METSREDEAPVGVALFVDGPNVLREEFDVDLDDVRRAAEAQGPLVTTRLYLDEHATPGLIQAAEARGFEVIVTSGDVDVKLAVDAARFAAEGRMSILAIASRDTDFKPVVETANGYGIRTLAIAPGEFGRSDALRNAANDSVTLEEDADSDDEGDTDGEKGADNDDERDTDGDEADEADGDEADDADGDEEVEGDAPRANTGTTPGAAPESPSE